MFLLQKIRAKARQWLTMLSLLIMLNGGLAFSASAQCAMCKGSAEDAAEDKEQMVATSLNDAILYLLAMPYLAAGTIGFLYYYNTRLKKPQNT